MERGPKQTNQDVEAVAAEEEKLDPRAVGAFEYLTNQVDYSGLSYDEIMDSDENLDEMRTVRHKRGRNLSHNTLYMSELLIGSKYSDNKFWNETVEKVASLPDNMKPDNIVVGGLYMGDFGGKSKNSRWMLKPGLRTLDDQFRAGKEKLDQLQELGIPVVYTRSDNDTQIIEEMTFEAFGEMLNLAKKHAKASFETDDSRRQLSNLEKAKANPNWTEYSRFTKYVAFPYCMRVGRSLRSAEEVAELTGGEYVEPEREILFDAYKTQAHGGRLKNKHKAVLDPVALKGDTPKLTIVGDFEHEINTRGSEYTDLVRHKFQSSNLPLANYFRKPDHIRGVLGAEGDDKYSNIILTGSQEAAGVFRPDNEAIHSIGSMQDPKKALREDGDILTSTANTIARPIFGRGRFHDPSATSIERTDDGRQIVTVFNKNLWEISESIPERTTIFMQCDWQGGNLASRPDYQLKQLDMVNRRLGEGAVVLALGGDMVEGRNYFDFNRESGRTGLGAMDQQIDFVKRMIERSLEQLSRDEIENLVVKATIGNHEWNSGTLKVNGYSFADPFIDPYRAAFMARGYSLDEAYDRVAFQDTIETDRGEPLKTYSTMFKVGEMGFELRHFFGAGKGTGGQPPAFAGYRRQQTQGGLHKNTNVGIFGHYHHPNYMVGGNKLYVGSGALNGITGFEYEKGLRSANAVVALKVGAGLPPQIEVMGEQYLRNYKIKDGYFSDKEIRERHGFRNDRGSDPMNSPYIEGEKTALQKVALELGRQAAYSADRSGKM